MREFPMDAKTTREAFGEALIALAKEDETIVAVSADTVTSSGLTEMSKLLPDRVYTIST